MKKLIILVIVVCALVFAGLYIFDRWFSVKIDAEVMEATASRGIIERVSKIAVVPDDEDPVVATVNDLRPLAGKPFFKNAKVGYKLLVYKEAGRGILYDPVKNKIVEMATISLGNLPE